MRPRSDLRAALLPAAQALVGRGIAPTWRDLLPYAPPGTNAGLVRRAVVNMAAAGELHPSGTRRVPGACRPMRTYTTNRPGNWATQGGQLLAEVMGRWTAA